MTARARLIATLPIGQVRHNFRTLLRFWLILPFSLVVVSSIPTMQNAKTEDYEGPSSSGYFQWMPDENGQMRPVTRMKKKIVEKKRSFWERDEQD